MEIFFRHFLSEHGVGEEELHFISYEIRYVVSLVSFKYKTQSCAKKYKRKSKSKVIR